MSEAETEELEPWEIAWHHATTKGDPLAFATGVLGFLMPGDPNPNARPQLEAWQVTALKKFGHAWRHRFEANCRLSIRSGHGVGKTCFLSILILFTLLCGGHDTKNPVVANRQNQLRDGI